MTLTPLSPAKQRIQHMQELPHVEWEVIVIGGGATGLGVAVDAAARGYRTLLLEAHDFAKGTSSKTTKLIHGGVRYLAQGNFPIVQEALKERQILLENAPHVVQLLPFILPTYQCHELPLYAAGLKMYDLLAGSTATPKSKILRTQQIQDLVPSIRSTALKGGMLYYDAQFDDSRLAISLMRTLEDVGGIALNYCAVRSFLKEEGQIVGVVAENTLTHETCTFRAKAVVNATGVWVDTLRQSDTPEAKKLVRPSKGVHVVVDQSFFPTDHAVLIPKTPDGRVLFMIPWHGKVLIGTTDTPQPDTPIDPIATEADIDFILRTVNPYLVNPIARKDVRSVWAGLRPLIDDSDNKQTKQLSREHRVYIEKSGLVTVTGGKWTTYRKIAADVVDTLIQQHQLGARIGKTEKLRIHGAPTSQDAPCLPYYGSDTGLLQSLPGWDIVLDPLTSITEAHIRFAVRYEKAYTLEDVIARRTRLLFLDALQALRIAPRVAAIMAEELEKDEAWMASTVKDFEQMGQLYYPSFLLHGSAG